MDLAKGMSPRTVPWFTLLLAGLFVYTEVVASEQSCQRQFAKDMGECAAKLRQAGQVSAGNSNFWLTCQQELKPKLAACLAGTSGGSMAPTPRDPGDPPLGCDEAKQNIDWVLSGDRGARATYNSGRQTGMSRCDAVLHAQGHNGGAQQSIERCRPWSCQYIESVMSGNPLDRQGSSGGGETPRQPTPTRAVPSSPIGGTDSPPDVGGTPDDQQPPLSERSRDPPPPTKPSPPKPVGGFCECKHHIQMPHVCWSNCSDALRRANMEYREQCGNWLAANCELGY